MREELSKHFHHRGQGAAVCKLPPGCKGQAAGGHRRGKVSLGGAEPSRFRSKDRRRSNARSLQGTARNQG